MVQTVIIWLFQDIMGIFLFFVICIRLVWSILYLNFYCVWLSRSYGSWIYNYLCNQCHFSYEFKPYSRWSVLNATLCDKICQSLATCQWFSPGTLVSSTNKTDCHDIAEILLKMALNAISQNLTLFSSVEDQYEVYCIWILLLFMIFFGGGD